MPGAQTSYKLLPASEPSASDDASQLDQHLQNQLEEDIARIFDESIYSDLEVVCGKLKILTHSCILKARTNKFYHRLQNILHANIGRNTFDELYSFISDAYTECNIKHQENEIITYLDDNLNIVKSDPTSCCNRKEELEDPEVFSTPKCITPYKEKGFEKSISSSPSTELTKEYYALVPIDGNLLDKELIEQDVLSNAFESIIKSQPDDINKSNDLQLNKPTSLPLTSSHTAKIVKHSNSCDSIRKLHRKDDISIQVDSSINEIKVNTIPSQNKKSCESTVTRYNIDNINKAVAKSEYNFGKDSIVESTYSPDSLVTDDPSSSSDYLSAAYTCSPSNTSACFPQLNVGDNITKMDLFTSSDSGVENNGLQESVSSHKDVTITETHDLTLDDGNNSHNSLASPLGEKIQRVIATTSSDKDQNGQQHNQLNRHKDVIGHKTSKEEKQRQNEEIVILESSSLSSETGSWESVFPPKLAEKEICEKFINTEIQHSIENICGKSKISNVTEYSCSNLVQKPFTTTSCFIDAASLVDEGDDTLETENNTSTTGEQILVDILPAPSQPMPCSTVKLDISPNDWSESNENEDSLEQPDVKDPDSLQKDLSPTIFEMTITDDLLCSQGSLVLEERPKSKCKSSEGLKSISSTSEMPIVKSAEIVENDEHPVQTQSLKTSNNFNKREFFTSSTVFMSSTPHNSIMSLKGSALKQYESEGSESVGRESLTIVTKLKKYNESSPIISGGASIDDHLPQANSQSCSPLTRRKVENIPIVSGAYVPPVEETNHRKSPKPACASAWVVDMSEVTEVNGEKNIIVANNNVKKPSDKACTHLRSESKCSSNESCNKSRSSVDSDSSERSSHRFYIDLASLPDPLPPQKKNSESDTSKEKKNMFSMFIDLGEKSSVKEMPARLTSTLITKKNSITDNKIPKTANVADASDLQSTINFEKFESLCNDPNISISEIISLPEKLTKNRSSDKENTDIETTVPEKNLRNVVLDTSRQHKTTVIEEEPTSDQTADVFVKLSDLDKPVQKTDTCVVINEERVLDVRMTRSIPDNNWNQSGSSRSIDVMRSFHSENALSLNRLFPHLKNEFSRSMPGSLSGRVRPPHRSAITASPGEIDEQASETSAMSSMQSSMGQSAIESSTTEDNSQTSSLIGQCQSRLGQDLLRMFLEEIAPDVTVEVSGKRIRAHKCILSSRCQYFAGILSGGWVESAGNIIVLPPFTFNAVHFALCHIYSGVSTIPESISIVELATIADMLSLDGLKDAIMFTLKAKYCHHFHRPCAVCTAGVLECFTLSSVYGLDDLYRKCLKWITKFFYKIWPTKAFATLHEELIEKCYQQLIIDFTPDSVISTVYGSGQTMMSLQQAKWAETVLRLCRNLLNATSQYAASNLTAVLKATSCVHCENPAPVLTLFDEFVHAAIFRAKPDELCPAYTFLTNVCREVRNNFSRPDILHGSSLETGYSSYLQKQSSCWRAYAEKALVDAAPRVVTTQAFKNLSPDLRNRLRELGCLIYKMQPLAWHPMETSTPNPIKRSIKIERTVATTSRSLNLDHLRGHVGSTDTLKSSNDLRDKKFSFRTPKVRTTKAQEERAKFNMAKKTQEQIKSKPVRGGSSSTVRPRYLEPKVSKDEKKLPAKKAVPKIISSTESSRNSSPNQIRTVRSSRLKSQDKVESQGHAMSQDSLMTSSRPRTAEPSTDSRSESQASNIYATYTKVKHMTGSIECIQSHGPSQKRHVAVADKPKTKIPVYSQNNKNEKRVQPKRASSLSKPTANQPRKPERKVPGSLMNATKSSSAKIVPKINKENHTAKPQRHATKARVEHEPVPSVMQRSGTFLKDEATFLDESHLSIE